MHLPLVVIISGPPCTGKSTLAHIISDKFHLPLFSKDETKELLFDTLGWSDRAWSKKLSGVSYDLLYQYMRAQLMTENSFVIEGDLKPEDHTERLTHLQRIYPFHPFQIQFHADGEVLFDRFKKRSETPKLRHPGHVDHLNYEELGPLLRKGYFEPIDVGGELVRINTTDFAKVNYSPILHKIEILIHKIHLHMSESQSQGLSN